VVVKHNAEDAFDSFKKYRFEVVITDINLPNINGFEFLANIKSIRDDFIPIIMTAYSSNDYLKSALYSGAIEYLDKPVKFEDIKKILKICSQKIESNNLLSIKICNNITLIKKQMLLIVNNCEILLSDKEMKLIELLYNNREKVLSKDIIFDNVWNNEECSDKALRNLISRVRKKLDGYISIKNLQNIGYMLKCE
jgi:DNA-binding response OmpR family regulator